jgi:hypothetical protein
MKLGHTKRSAEREKLAKALLRAGKLSASKIGYQTGMTLGQIYGLRDKMKASGELGPERQYPSQGRA